MRELLGLEADTGMKLHFEPLAGIRLDPLAVESLVLVIRPGILDLVQLEALVLQPLDIRPDALSVASFLVLKGVTDRVRYLRNGLLREKARIPSSFPWTFSLMRSRPFRRCSKPIRFRSGSWLSMARSAGEILSRSRAAIRSHSSSTRSLAASSRDWLRSSREEPWSPDLSVGARSPGGHFRWYSSHIQRDSADFSCHFSAAACSLAEARWAAAVSSAATSARRST